MGFDVHITRKGKWFDESGLQRSRERVDPKADQGAADALDRCEAA